MKVSTPEISWHDRGPVYSVDFQHVIGNDYRLATCGTDGYVRIWKINADAKVEFVANLSRHTKTVNVVRFSPNGYMLASAGDDSTILLWRHNRDVTPTVNLFQDEEDENKENWSAFKTLRSHVGDVYDVSWSADSLYLVSGSVDNSAILWDVKKGCRLGLFPEHKSYVQGVSFDPVGKFITTMSCDRSLRIYNINSKTCVHNIKKLSIPSSAVSVSTDDEKPKSFRMFQDDSMKSFFRRHSYSPDGNLLVVSAGCIEKSESVINTSYVFTRTSIPKPVLHLPGALKTSIAVRFCPRLFELRPNSRENVAAIGDNNKKEEWEKYETMFCLPYRMVFAIATEDSLLLYDTQQPIPFASISDIHYHQLSDISWTHDGTMLITSSTDGYCSIVSFNEDEIGKPYKDQIIKISTQETLSLLYKEKEKSKSAKKAENRSAQKISPKSSLSSPQLSLQQSPLTLNQPVTPQSDPPLQQTPNAQLTPVTQQPTTPQQTPKVNITPVTQQPSTPQPTPLNQQTPNAQLTPSTQQPTTPRQTQKTPKVQITPGTQQPPQSQQHPSTPQPPAKCQQQSMFQQTPTSHKPSIFTPQQLCSSQSLPQDQQCSTVQQSPSTSKPSMFTQNQQPAAPQLSTPEQSTLSLSQSRVPSPPADSQDLLEEMQDASLPTSSSSSTTPHACLSTPPKKKPRRVALTTLVRFNSPSTNSSPSSSQT